MATIFIWIIHINIRRIHHVNTLFDVAHSENTTSASYRKHVFIYLYSYIYRYILYMQYIFSSRTKNFWTAYRHAARIVKIHVDIQYFWLPNLNNVNWMYASVCIIFYVRVRKALWLLVMTIRARNFAPKRKKLFPSL